MDKINALLLALSILMTSVRNILSKRISGARFGTRQFFILQSIIFTVGIGVLLLLNPSAFSDTLPITPLYGFIYGVFLLTAQWCYTVALFSGATSICATVYSMAFVIPTVSGMIFWHDEVSLPKIAGIAIVIPAIILSGMSDTKPTARTNRGVPFVIPITVAMLASGGVGIVQKLQRSAPDQTPAVVIIAFILSALASAVSAVVAKPAADESSSGMRSNLLLSLIIGACYSVCNLLNTELATRLPSTVFFPTVNVGTIILSLTLGIVCFREKLGIRKIAVILLGITSIFLITFS